MRRTLLLSAAVSLSLVAAACAEDQPTIRSAGGDQEDQGEGHAAQGTVTIAGEEATNHGRTDVAGDSEFELELDDFYFGPTILEGEAGQSLTVSLHNEGDAPHTFTIDGVVDDELQPGDEGTAEVTYPDSGALVFYCRFHRGGGMLGALSVGGSLEAGSSDGSGTGGSGTGGYGYG
jgi:plastocyanin